jgi:methyl-accepting chemotaxis protein
MEVAHATTMTWQALGHAELAATSAEVASTETASVLAEVRTLAGVQAARALTATGTVRSRADTLRRVLWGIFIVALTIGVTSAWLTGRSVDGPLARLVAATQRFSTGDLRATDLNGMPAELAALGSAMNSMGTRIRQLLSAVGLEGQEIGSSASDFSAMSQELAATSGQVSEAMVHLTQAADSQVGALRDADRHLAALRDTGATTLRAAQRVTTVAASIAAMAQDHRTHVQTASATLMTLRETVRTSAGEVREAIRLADRLGGIVERDRQLATKVGVLAVNTSIEAARAGIHGQGIVAVAEELRLLGELCEQVADEGERGVEAIRAQVRATAATLDAGTTAVLGVEATADRAATALAEIIRSVAEANRAAAQVVQDAAASREGITAMLERTALVARAAADHAATGESVSAAAEEQAAATQEMATAAARLNDAAQRLTALLGDFRT